MCAMATACVNRAMPFDPRSARICAERACPRPPGPTQGYEMPYNVAQFGFIYNSAKVGRWRLSMTQRSASTPHPGSEFFPGGTDAAPSSNRNLPAPASSRPPAPRSPTPPGRGPSLLSSSGLRPTRAASPSRCPPTAILKRRRSSGTSSTRSADILTSRHAGAYHHSLARARCLLPCGSLLGLLRAPRACEGDDTLALSGAARAMRPSFCAAQGPFNQALYNQKVVDLWPARPPRWVLPTGPFPPARLPAELALAGHSLAAAGRQPSAPHGAV